MVDYGSEAFHHGWADGLLRRRYRGEASDDRASYEEGYITGDAEREDDPPLELGDGWAAAVAPLGQVIIARDEQLLNVPVEVAAALAARIERRAAD